MGSMSKYEKNREEADAQLEAANEEAWKADVAVTDAEARLEAAERDVDVANAAGDSEAAQAAADRVNAIDAELIGLHQDFESAVDQVTQVAQSWGLSD